jgi:glycerophosphoryl diester phosphodiesterase
LLGSCCRLYKHNTAPRRPRHLRSFFKSNFTVAIRIFRREGVRAMTILQAYQRVWRLRWHFLTAHVAMTLIAAAIVSPLVAAMVRLAVDLSGAPALADQDIARFLLSPAGLAGAIVVASALIVVAVLETAVLMRIHMTDRHGARTGFLRGLAAVVRRLPKLLAFAALLVGRVLIIALPFLLLAALVAWHFLTGHDINYFLSTRPPEFIRAAILIAIIAAAMGGLLVERLVSWSMALPGLLFSGFSAAGAFRESADITRGRRMRIAALLIGWALISLAIGAIVAGAAGVAARLALVDSGFGFGVIAAFMLGVLLLWFLANMFATTLTSGSLAVLLAEQLGVCGAPVTVAFAAEDAEEDKRAGAFRIAAVAIGIAAVAAFAGGLAMLADVSAAGDVEVIAHRGAAGSRPENTLASVQKAIEDGADWVEIDVQETADGDVVVLHDSDFMKIAGVDLKIWDTKTADLADIDIGSWFAPEYSGERTPTLTAVLKEAKGSNARVLIELKYYGHDQRLEERVAQIVEAAGMVESIAIMSLDYPAVRKMKALRPDWQVGLLAATAIGYLTRLEADFLAVSTGLASVNLVRRARAADLDVYVWTVNDPITMSRMVSRGVAGLITDEPGLAREVLSDRASLGPAEQLVLVGADLLGLDLSPRAYRDDSP